MINNHSPIVFKSFLVIFEQRPLGLEVNIPLEVGSSNVDITNKAFNIKSGTHYKIKIGYMSSEPIANLVCHIHTFKKSMPCGRDKQKIDDITSNSNDLEFIFPKFGWDDASTQSSAMGDYSIKMFFKIDDKEIATFKYSFNIAPDWEIALPA